MPFIYLASPYTSPDPTVQTERHRQAEVYTAEMFRWGVTIFSPIVHNHQMAALHNLPVDFEFWREHNFNMLDDAAALYVLALPGWRTSKGVAAEMAHAKEREIAIHFVHIEDVEPCLVPLE